MAITRSDKIGRTRIKLAELLSDTLNANVFPENLDSNLPAYSTKLIDACSWDGSGTIKGTGEKIHMFSWDTMGDCIKNGIQVSQDPRDWEKHNYEIHANR